MYRHPRPGNTAFTLIELLVVIGIIAILLGLTLSAVQRVREAAARARCQNNIRQLALALHQYHEANGGFAQGHQPFSVNTANGMPYPGWTLSILPFVEQQPRYDQGVAAYRAKWNPFPPQASGRDGGGVPPAVGSADPASAARSPGTGSGAGGRRIGPLGHGSDPPKRAWS